MRNGRRKRYKRTTGSKIVLSQNDVTESNSNSETSSSIGRKSRRISKRGKIPQKHLIGIGSSSNLNDGRNSDKWVFNLPCIPSRGLRRPKKTNDTSPVISNDNSVNLSDFLPKPNGKRNKKRTGGRIVSGNNLAKRLNIKNVKITSPVTSIGTRIATGINRNREQIVYSFSFEKFVDIALDLPIVYDYVSSGKGIYCHHMLVKKECVHTDGSKITLFIKSIYDILLLYDKNSKLYYINLLNGKFRTVSYIGIRDYMEKNNIPYGGSYEAQGNAVFDYEEMYKDNEPPPPPISNDDFEDMDPKIYKKYFEIGGGDDELYCDALKRYVTLLGKDRQYLVSATHIGDQQMSRYFNEKKVSNYFGQHISEKISVSHTVAITVALRLCRDRAEHLLKISGERLNKKYKEDRLFDMFIAFSMYDVDCTIKNCNRVLNAKNLNSLSVIRNKRST